MFKFDSSGTVIFPYVLDGYQLVFNTTSNNSLELSRNLLIKKAGTTTAIVVGKITRTQRDTYENRKRKFNGTLIYDESMNILDGEIICPLNGDDLSWAHTHSLPVTPGLFEQPHNITPETVSSTSSVTVQPPSQLSSPAHAQVKQILDVMLTYHLELFPDLETSDYIDLMTVALKQYQAVNSSKKSK